MTAKLHSMDEMMKAGCTTQRGLRFWEEKGLLGEVQRSPGGGVRRYTDEQMERAAIISAAQFGAWPLDAIKEMVEKYDYEVYSALMTRLEDQIRAAARLAGNLPKRSPPVEYDL